jgi:hypothetical protein
MSAMTPGLVVAAGFLALAVTSATWGRAMNGKPRAFLIQLGLCIAVGVWHTATQGVLTVAWVLFAIALTLVLIALTMFAARHSR